MYKIKILDRKVLKFRRWDKEKKMMIYFELDGDNVMQATGLKDKNGKEIYEGDIIKGVGIEPETYIVRWSNKHGGFVFIYGDQIVPAHYFLVESCEVIGNIYESPDLKQRR